ncbi:MAG: thioesterase, partial [Candidatus Rokubacteria bacterium]|nr:thioesterase [Candidatus Rokubacteria bacterium]
MDVRPGASAEVEITVTPDQTADRLGNPGVQVFATPVLVGLLEQAAGA